MSAVWAGQAGQEGGVGLLTRWTGPGTLWCQLDNNIIIIIIIIIMVINNISITGRTVRLYLERMVRPSTLHWSCRTECAAHKAHLNLVTYNNPRP